MQYGSHKIIADIAASTQHVTRNVIWKIRSEERDGYCVLNRPELWPMFGASIMTVVKPQLCLET